MAGCVVLYENEVKKETTLEVGNLFLHRCLLRNKICNFMVEGSKFVVFIIIINIW